MHKWLMVLMVGGMTISLTATAGHHGRASGAPCEIQLHSGEKCRDAQKRLFNKHHQEELEKELLSEIAYGLFYGASIGHSVAHFRVLKAEKPANPSTKLVPHKNSTHKIYEYIH